LRDSGTGASVTSIEEMGEDTRGSENVGLNANPLCQNSLSLIKFPDTSRDLGQKVTNVTHGHSLRARDKSSSPSSMCDVRHESDHSSLQGVSLATANRHREDIPTGTTRARARLPLPEVVQDWDYDDLCADL
jgi:hypothetical protein